MSLQLKKNKSIQHQSITSTTSKEALDDVHPEIDPLAERRLLRKMDITLLPMFTLMYCVNFIDRTAIGNARIAGLENDLGMKGFDLNIALTVFYIFYTVTEVPANLVTKRFGANWLAFLIFAFGVIAIGSAFVKSYTGLLVTRVFLGMAESGTLPGLVYLLSRFYRRKEVVLRIGIFFGVSPALAGAFGGLLASGLLSIPDFSLLVRWRKIFFIEGLITAAYGIILFFILPDDPQTTRLFNEEERALAIARLDADSVVKNGNRREDTTIKLILRSFNFQTSLIVISFLMMNISFQGLSLFLPTVIISLGHFTTVQAQLRTVPPFLVGSCWAVISGYVCFRTKLRGPIIFASALLAVAGYAISIATTNQHARYGACFLSIAGGSAVGPLLLTWGVDNAAPDTVRAITSGVIAGLGAIGSIIAVWTYLPTDSPNYHHGNSLNLATCCTICVTTLIIMLYLHLENLKRERGERDYRLEGKTAKEIEELGYLHPRFRFQL